LKCRACGHSLQHSFADLGHAPPSNSYLSPDQLYLPEVYYPLKTFVCEKCWLVQIDEYKASAEIFDSSYAYFSSYSSSWLKHSKNYVEHICNKLNLTTNSLVAEIASNDGYLLQYFLEKKIPCIGIEPTESTAKAAREKGIQTITEFFGVAFAQQFVTQYGKADLLLGNNVLAHVPDIKDFTSGLAIALAPNGSITMEFPHLLNLIKFHQFDTIYHEHFSYLSLLSVHSIFNANGLEIYHVEQLPTHGGSLRIYAKHSNNTSIEIDGTVNLVLKEEQTFGLSDLSIYTTFQASLNLIKNSFLLFLLNAKAEGKKVAAYGAAAKGNTLLNYCGVKTDLIEFVADANPHKIGKRLPGSHIPVVGEQELKNLRPDYIILFPWNLQEEITKQLSYASMWGASLVVAVPELKIIPL
jgi:hypothetical protein